MICACAGGEVWDAAEERPLCVCPGVERMALSPGGEYLYLLCGDSDSVVCCRIPDGEILFVNRAGAWPQDLRLDALGRRLAVAGGASGEVLVFSAPDLTLERRFAVPGAACQAVFMPGGLAVLLALEEGRLLTVLGEVGERGYREWMRMPGLPGMLCPAPGCRLMVGGMESLCCFDWHRRRCLWQRPRNGLPFYGQMHPCGLLLSDSLRGSVSLWNPAGEETFFEGESVFAVHNEPLNGLY